MATETPDAEMLDRMLSGELGLPAQLCAFKHSWAIAGGYVRLIRQAAAGSAQECADTASSTELAALLLGMRDLEDFFVRCELGIQVLQLKEQSAGEARVH
jgi:hypothetical protein